MMEKERLSALGKVLKNFSMGHLKQVENTGVDKAMRKDATIVLIFALIAYTLIVVSVYYTQSYVIFQSRGLPVRRRCTSTLMKQY
jgi:hypothetical protein